MTWTPSEGETVAESYRLLESLSEGGVSDVWRARSLTEDREVALKRPNYGSSNDDATVERSLRRELEVLKRLRAVGGHPNVVGLVDEFTHRDQPFLAIDYVEGHGLHKHVEARGGFDDVDTVRGIAVALGTAVSFLHRNNVAYRDVKPDNLILTPDRGPVLIDFNTARAFDPERSPDADPASETVVPNPGFQPPELNNDPELVGFPQGPWSDVYAVGKTVVYALSGATVRADAVDLAEVPGVDADSVPRYLRAVVERATRRHPSERYRTATALTHALKTGTVDSPTVARVEFEDSGRVYDVFPGDTVGRDRRDGRRPSIAVDDPGEHISPVQFRLGADAEGNWLIEDRSLNGTWLRRHDEWHRLLGPEGRERLQEMGEDTRREDGTQPPQRARLRDGDRIAPVHPDYGAAMRFRA